MSDRRLEPLTVTALRQQIRRGVPDSLLFRLAGGEAEYRRLALEYDLKPARAVTPPTLPTRSQAPLPKLRPAPAAVVTHEDMVLSDRQEILLGMIAEVAQAGEVFPGVRELGDACGVSWLVIERDLRTLVRKGTIRMGTYRCNGEPVRRVEIVGTKLKTALPAPNHPPYPARQAVTA